MRYWCPECKSEINTEVILYERDGCPFCAYGCQERLSDFETPTQYEKRTGKKWNGAVWYKSITAKEWEAVDMTAIEIKGGYLEGYIHLCANTPEPPPDDFVPEEEI